MIKGLAALCIAGAAIKIFVFRGELHFDAILKPVFQTLENTGPAAPFFYCIIYIVSSVFFFPVSVLTFAAGAVFGWRGTFLVLFSAVFSALISFLAGRFTGLRWVEHQLLSHPRLRFIDNAIARDGRKTVMLARLSPFLPYSLVNFAFGLTRVNPRDFLFGTAIGMVPGILAQIYLGSAVGDLGKLSAGMEHATQPVEVVLGLLGAAASISLLAYFSNLAKKSLSEAK